MSKSPLYRSAFTAGACRPTDILDFHRRTFGDLRMEDDPTNDGGQGGDFVDPDTGEKFAFPPSTPQSDMTAEQRAEYWRHKSQKHEKRANARSDYDDLKAKAAELDQLRADQQTEQEKAVTAAREEGRKHAEAEANRKVATALYKAALTARDIKGDELTDLMAAFNPDAFINGDDVDTDRVAVLASRYGAGTHEPDTGQGRGRPGAPTAGEAGKAEAQRRFGSKTA